eukprot:comp19463_c0_seq1/m.22646 comp19463_c0_seq1/g.22646  ORF comp19463_c0_seq1/g.22646 comp19463_c0_seq1/m.22646 type:complete len:545 (-) comp19463_c0_seq1:68-1702(-)
MATAYWFRKALRLHDSPSLAQALVGCEQLLPVFVLDPWFVKSGRVGANRMLFLLQTLQDLDTSLRAFGSRLIVYQGNPDAAWPDLIATHKIKRVVFESDTEPYAKQRDTKVEKMCSELGVQCVSVCGHTLYDPNEYLKTAGGTPPLTYQACVKIMSKMGPPAEPLPAPASLPPLPPTIEPGTHLVPENLPAIGYEDIPPAKKPPFPGGETEGLKRMKEFVAKEAYINTFEKPKTDPTMFDPPATTVLSPYLKFGCLSVRLFHKELKAVESAAKKCSQPPVSLLGQIYWREFFYQVANATPNFDKMVGNKICRQVPWEDNKEYLDAWANGRTGYPFVDAAMTQLREWGWMHHLARHVVACFLTRGDLWISWEEGVAVFDRLLLDADWSLNNGNWLWLSASAFFHQFHRVYSPISFGKKYDKEGRYIKRFIPALAKMPSKYIYEPWTAPIEVQRKAGCIIGQDYPHPIVEHETMRSRNVQRMALVYKGAKAEDVRAINTGNMRAVKTEDGGSGSEEEEKKPKAKARVKKETGSQDVGQMLKRMKKE